MDGFQVEQRRKEALSQIGDDGALAAEPSLLRLISRYRFLDLWPCSSFDLDHMSRQQVHSTMSLLESCFLTIQLLIGEGCH